MKRYPILLNIIPDTIALLIIFSAIRALELFPACLLWLIYVVTLRFTLNSAIIVHGLGHTIAIAIVDRELSAINSIDIVENQNIADILRSLLPFQPIFIPILSPYFLVSSHHPSKQQLQGQAASLSLYMSPYVTPGKSEQIRFKAIGGIALNLLVAIIVFVYFNSFFSRALVAANLLVALSSTSDLAAFITGVADYFCCGNFGFIAFRQPDDEQTLLPERMRTMVLQMGEETEVRGEQAGGGLVVGTQGNKSAFIDRKIVFVGKKIVNRKRSNLTKSLEAAFAPVRNRAIAAGVKPLANSVMGIWHYRYATSGTAPSELETHWHEWIEARDGLVWEFTGREWVCKTRNVNHRITHNGDFDSWNIFDRDIDSTTLGLWLERVLHTPNATQGDSPKIAGMMDLLVTQGMWSASVRLAYQQTIAASIGDAFNGEKPTADAPNTALSDRNSYIW